MSSSHSSTPPGILGWREHYRPWHRRCFHDPARVPDRPSPLPPGRSFPLHYFVTLGELTQCRVIRDWDPRRMANFEAWRHRVGLLPYDEVVAIKWGEIQGNAHLRGRPRPVNDSWIAACCLAHDLPLATFNTKDF